MILDEILNYSFIISTDMSIGNSNTFDDTFGRICVAYKTQDVKLKVFNTSKGINE